MDPRHHGIQHDHQILEMAIFQRFRFLRSSIGSHGRRRRKHNPSKNTRIEIVHAKTQIQPAAATTPIPYAGVGFRHRAADRHKSPSGPKQGEHATSSMTTKTAPPQGKKIPKKAGIPRKPAFAQSLKKESTEPAQVSRNRRPRLPACHGSRRSHGRSARCPARWRGPERPAPQSDG